MGLFVSTARTTIIGTAWSAPATAPGLGAGVTIAGTITTNATDISQWTSGPDVGFQTDMVESTDNASGGFKEFLPGLSSGDDIAIPLSADFAASQIWVAIQTVFGTLGVSRPGDVVRYADFKPTNAARGTTNPSFVVAVFSKGVQPLKNAVGAKADHGLVLQVTGGFAVLTA